ncbi:uncharacterized protein LOC127866744 [Dreissena polymorpha]|uniref:VWFA domain-containing protein n=1 Tax=Dreissena polymorpha TaxID=45954 RepID=A0A9D4RE35_DREPO|nr:uncharacterized protein LOC127866744 [Dreissena polymorpha]KAH3864088.1 hypothetical protein DPMN_027102 [Dreissena polymorpha]
MALPNGNMEIVFSFDTTGSMSSCLAEVRGRVSDMVQRLQTDIPGIKVGLFAHGDYCDAHTSYVTKFVDLTNDLPKLVDFAKTVGSTGGGDSDECYELVLHEVRTKLSWTPGTQRALVMIGDCNPHEPSYKQNTLKLDWRKEADALGKMGVRIYAVQCGSYSTSDKFYSDIARRTDGQHLKLSDFTNVFDMLMTVCYREKGDDLFHAYEKEVRERGAIHKDMDTMFVNLRDKAPASWTASGSSVSAPPKLTKKNSKPKAVKLTKTIKAKKLISPKLIGKIRRSVKTPTKKPPTAALKKYHVAFMPRLRRENVPECNFMLKNLSWSTWQHVISPDKKITISCSRSGLGCGYRTQQIFGGKTKVPAIYEVAVQIRQRSRKYVVFSKFSRRGFSGKVSWEKQLIGKKDIKAQIDKVVQKNCNVFVRRADVKTIKTRDEIENAQKRYDYAWQRIRNGRSGHRHVTKTDVDISEPMES